MATTQSISPLFSPQTIRRRSKATKFSRCDAQDLRLLLAAEAKIDRSRTVPRSKRSVRPTGKAVQR
jgi:hypothetical protein